ncbi:MAG: cupin domain-containing protein [Firmicutes bacterium]|nr:cupin domain-containing protein [Bacillota bacterium]
MLVCHRDQAQGVREVARWAGPLAGALARGRLPAGPAEERPWGQEIRWASGPGYAARLLQLWPGRSLGPTAEPARHETFWVQSGRGRLRLGEAWQPLGTGDVFTVPPGAVLEVQAVTSLALVGVSAPAGQGG